VKKYEPSFVTTTAATIGTLSAGLDVFGNSTFKLFETMYVARHHHDDEEHEHHVDHRGDVDLGESASGLAALHRSSAHGITSFLVWQISWAKRQAAASSRRGLRARLAVRRLGRKERDMRLRRELSGDVLHHDVHVRSNVPDRAIDDVERDDGGDRDEEADAGGDQRFGDAHHDVAHRVLALASELLKRLDDAEDRADEADERAIVTDGAEERRSRSRTRFCFVISASTTSRNASGPCWVHSRHGSMTAASIDLLFFKSSVALASRPVLRNAMSLAVRRSTSSRPRNEEDDSLEHDRDRDDGEGDHEPEDPTAATRGKR